MAPKKKTVPDWLKGFPLGFQADVMEAIEDQTHSRIVAVDANGTLWRHDLGEHFLQWLCGLVDDAPDPSLLPASVWKDYQKLMKKDRTGARGFAVQVMAGIEYSDLVTWMDYVAASWRYYKPKMAALLNGLREEGGMKVYVVTSSSALLARRAMLYLDAEIDGLFGVEATLDDLPGVGLVLTDQLAQPIPCNAGKLEILQMHAGTPSIVIGGSLENNELFDTARWKLVVGHSDEPKDQMMTLAEQRGWHHHTF